MNARTARVEALFFLTEYVKDASVAVLHVYFPDPWPKARHHKRRLIQEPFMKQAARVLAPSTLTERVEGDARTALMAYQA